MTSLAEQMAGLAKAEGSNETLMPGIRIFKSSQSKPRRPLVYDKGVIIVAQGSKRVYLDNKIYDYNPDNYLVLALPIPAECETHATPGQPLLCMMVDIDLGVLNTIIEQMDTHIDHACFAQNRKQHALFVSQMTPQIQDTVMRLLNALQSPIESSVLGRGLEQELIFRIMCGENARSLYALAMKSTNLSRLDKALKQIHGNYQNPMKVETLAALVNMSPSSFHRAFKDATSSSPIQYIKKIRLNKARDLLENRGLRVNEAATQVGYESATQFSREFKRYFGDSPISCMNAHAM